MDVFVRREGKMSVRTTISHKCPYCKQELPEKVYDDFNRTIWLCSICLCAITHPISKVIKTERWHSPIY